MQFSYVNTNTRKRSSLNFILFYPLSLICLTPRTNVLSHLIEDDTEKIGMDPSQRILRAKKEGKITQIKNPKFSPNHSNPPPPLNSSGHQKKPRHPLQHQSPSATPSRPLPPPPQPSPLSIPASNNPSGPPCTPSEPP